MEVKCAAVAGRTVGFHREEFFSFSHDQFGRIYTTYRPQIYFLCLRMTGNSAEAEDLAQEAFLRLFGKLDTFRGESSFYTWLRRLAINVVLLRFETPRWRRETSLDELAQPQASPDSLSEMQFGCFDCDLGAVLDRIDLQRALDRLPAGFRTVLIMHDVEGYKHGEISRLMGCSIGTSKSQLHKARSKMRRLLGGPDGGELVA